MSTRRIGAVALIVAVGVVFVTSRMAAGPTSSLCSLESFERFHEELVAAQNALRSVA